MKFAPRAVVIVLALLLAVAPAVFAQSRGDTLVVLIEFGPNSMDIHGVGANFRAVDFRTLSKQ